MSSSDLRALSKKKSIQLLTCWVSDNKENPARVLRIGSGNRDDRKMDPDRNGVTC
jgi:hypothetical protein